MLSSANSTRRLALPALMVLLSILTACGGVGVDESVDWAALAEDELVAAGTDPEIVTCVLDLAAQDLKRGPLSPLGSEEAVRHCRTAHLAIQNAGATELPDTELAMTDVAWTFGDAADLDELWVRCEQGEGSACDELFQRSAVGSDYEEFGVSCGNRPDVVNCRELDQPNPDQG